MIFQSSSEELTIDHAREFAEQKEIQKLEIELLEQKIRHAKENAEIRARHAAEKAKVVRRARDSETVSESDLDCGRKRHRESVDIDIGRKKCTSAPHADPLVQRILYVGSLQSYTVKQSVQ